MNIPHKWPGKNKLIAMCAYMLMIEFRDSKTRVNWQAIAKESANQLKRNYPQIRYLMRTLVEFHQYQQRGKDNG